MSNFEGNVEETIHGMVEFRKSVNYRIEEYLKRLQTSTFGKRRMETVMKVATPPCKSRRKQCRRDNKSKEVHCSSFDIRITSRNDLSQWARQFFQGDNSLPAQFS